MSIIRKKILDMCRREICTGRQSCYFEQYTAKHGGFPDFKCIFDTQRMELPTFRLLNLILHHGIHFKSYSQKVVKACAVTEKLKKRNKSIMLPTYCFMY